MSIITKGIILAGDSGDKLYPLTMGVPKQLLPIYDKPMIFYPIKTLVEVGITDILIITSPQYISAFIQALGDGSEYGSKFTYATQTSPEGAAQALTIGAHFVGNEPVCMVTGDCIIEGEGVTEKLRKALRAAKIVDKQPSSYLKTMTLTNMGWQSWIKQGSVILWRANLVHHSTILLLDFMFFQRELLITQRF